MALSTLAYETSPFVGLNLASAVRAVQRGELVVYPTETFFAIGGDAFNESAVEQVYTAKSRDSGLPLPVILPGMEAVERVARGVCQTELDLMHRFWPGPLSILFQARNDVSTRLTGGTGLVAARVSSHPDAAALAARSGAVLVASSANVSGQPPAARAIEVDEPVQRAAAGILVATTLPAGGLPSTIVRVGVQQGSEVIHLIRRGAISPQELRDAHFVLA